VTCQDDASRRSELYNLLGDLPPRDHPITARLVAREEHEHYVFETLLLDLNGIEQVPAYWVAPKAAPAPFPTILYNHAHGNDYEIGKNELLLGRKALQAPPYAETLTSAGFAALCIDMWNFGERHARSESSLFKEMLWHGKVLWGMMVFDGLRAMDYLCGRPDVDSMRIGTLGLSMGSTMAWWLAALEPRISVCVDLCCLSDFAALIESHGLDAHGVYYYVPSLLKHFSTSDINALVAPSPHLSLVGEFDPLTPTAGLDRVDADLRRVYSQAGASGAWQLLRFPVGHQETAEMRQHVLAWLKRHLAPI
jgi:dienelactone hydrolase